MVLALGGGVGFLYGQALTAQISGAVNDPTGHLVPGARVELNNMETAQRRVGQADASGNFFFAQLFPGTYRISVRAAGFKRHEEANIFVAAAERVVLRSIALQLGDVTESVTVAAEGARADPKRRAWRADRPGTDPGSPHQGPRHHGVCPLFGSYLAAADPRRVHFGLRFRF